MFLPKALIPSPSFFLLRSVTQLIPPNQDLCSERKGTTPFVASIWVSDITGEQFKGKSKCVCKELMHTKACLPSIFCIYCSFGWGCVLHTHTHERTNMHTHYALLRMQPRSHHWLDRERHKHAISLLWSRPTGLAAPRKERFGLGPLEF